MTDPNEPVEMSPEDEAWVRAALRPLADVTMPSEVAGRIDQVLRNEAADLTRRVEASGDDDSAHEQTSAANSLRRRQQVMLGALACFIVIVIAGIVVSSHQTPTGSATSSAGVSITSGTSITKSGRSWSPEDLQQTLRQTLAGPPSSQVPQLGTATNASPSGSRGAAVSSNAAQGSAELANPADPARVTTLITDPAARQACIEALKESAGTEPIAVDAGTFNGMPAVAILFPSSAAANHVDIYVVGPNCSATEPNVLLFDRLPRP